MNSILRAFVYETFTVWEVKREDDILKIEISKAAFLLLSSCSILKCESWSDSAQRTLQSVRECEADD